MLTSLYPSISLSGVNINTNEIMFYDSNKQTREVHTLKAEHYVFIAIASFLIKQYVNNINENANEPDDASFAQKYLSAFGLIKNTTKLFYSERNEEFKHIELLNGLRVVCMLWIIFGHTFFYLAKGATLNLKDFVDLSTMFSFNLVFAANFAVDIFFWMSGFLGAYLLMCTIKKKDGEMPNPLLILIHRILRITPLYALVLLFHWTLMASVGNGPIFFLYERDEVNTCHSTWWIKLTYSSTIPEIHDYENKCMGWSWYLADDMQFFIFIPIIVYLIYHKRIFGMLFIVFYQTGCFGLTLYFIIKYDVKATYSEISHNYYSYYYYPAYSRFAPFTIGILVAMMLYSFKNETEEESICKKIMNKIDNQLIIRSIMYILGIAILITDYMFTYFVNIYPNSFSRTFTILYLIFSKALFVCGVSLIFLPAFMGHNRPTSWLFSQYFFAPLAKLTFGAYLVHPIFMTFDTYNSPGGKYVTMNRAIVNYLAWAVVSYSVSYMFSMIIEVPCIKEIQFLK